MRLSDRLLARFGEREHTWRLRVRLLRLRFRVARQVFAARYAAREASIQVSSLPHLLRNAVLPVTVAFGFVVGLDLLNGAAQDLAAGWGWARVESGAYDVLLEAIAAVTGVFLALYFTAVSTVAASVYVNVPHDIRALIVRDRLGNVYVTGVAFTMAFAVLLLISHALTGREYELAPVAIGIFAAFSIFAFIRLGQRAFYLADPTILANTLAYDFQSWLRRALQGGWRSSDPSFQAHYRRQAQRATSSLASLLAIASDQPHLRGNSVRQLTFATTQLLVQYHASRNRIPTNSKWFGERYEHKQWYLTDSTEVDMATSTGSGIQPNVVPDLAWVEQQLVEALLDLIASDLESANYTDVFSTVQRFEAIWTGLGKSWLVKETRGWTDDLTDLVEARTISKDQKPSTESPALVPAMWDAVSALPLALELGFHRELVGTPAREETPVRQLRQALEAADWTNASTPYGFDLPSDVIATLEQVQRGAAFEEEVDASTPTRTPGWYARELAFNSFERALQARVQALVGFLTSWYPKTASRLSEAGLHAASGAVLSRGLEVASKLQGHLQDWKEIATALREEPLRVDLVRPTWDWEDLRRKTRELQSALLKQLAASIPAQALNPPSDDVPDYLGQAVHLVGEECFRALADNDDELFAELFPTYFVGITVVVERIRAQVGDWQPLPAVTAIAEPMIDLMAISGYALIFSELHGNSKLRETSESAWRRIHSGAEARQQLTFLAAMHDHERHLFAMSHRMSRTRWQMTLGQMLAALPRDEPDHDLGHGAVKHDSALIRRLAPFDGGLGMVPYEASDVFVVRFLRTLNAAQGLDFGVAQHVIEALESNSDASEEK